MSHEARKAPQDKIDSSADISMKENQELLKRLEHDELMIIKKMKTTIGMKVNNETVFTTHANVPNTGLENFATYGNAMPFSVNVYTHHHTTQTKESEPVVIGG